MITLHNHDIAIYGGMNGKVLQNCSYIHLERENYEMGMPNNPDYISIETSENKAIKIYKLEYCATLASEPMEHILRTYLAQIF